MNAVCPATHDSSFMTHHDRCLVVGCGNTLRGDDGVGPYVIERLREALGAEAANTRLMAVPQLDVTLVTEICKANLVVFIDARVDENRDAVTIARIGPAADPVTPYHTSHTLSMPVLLRLARDWYGSAPDCYAVMPKGYDFAVWDGLSDRAREAASQAEREVMEILGSRQA